MPSATVPRSAPWPDATRTTGHPWSCCTPMPSATMPQSAPWPDAARTAGHPWSGVGRMGE
eukprot:560197-Lingulodinium_polyedra.AAC.1